MTVAKKTNTKTIKVKKGTAKAEVFNLIPKIVKVNGFKMDVTKIVSIVEPGEGTEPKQYWRILCSDETVVAATGNVVVIYSVQPK